MRRQLFLLLFFLLTLYSCDDGSIIQLPEKKPKIVFNCIGQNGNLWSGRLSLSQGILTEEPFKPLKDAKVNLYENDVYIDQLSFLTDSDIDISGALYKAVKSYPIPGKIYKVEVMSPPYEPLLASFVQPLPVRVDSLEITLLGPSATDENLINIRFRVSFTDPDEENFYEILIAANSGESPFPFSSQLFGLTFVDPAYKNNIPSVYALPTIFDDSYFNGKKVKFDFDSYLLNYSSGATSFKNYTVYIRNLSKEYYQYLKTANLQRDTEGDPFAQPVRVENNIQNGFGIFGGYTQTTKTVVFPN